MWDMSHVKTLKADERRRVQIPGIKGGQVFAFEDHGGIVTLTPLKKAEPRTIMLKMVRRDGHLIADTKGLKIDPDAIAQAVREERDSR
jgi:hypothetical protein